MSFWEFEKLKHSLVIQRQKSTTTTALEDILWQLAWIHYCWNVRSENSYETSNCLMQQLPRQCKGAVLLPDDKANLPFCVISLIQSDILFMWASLCLSVCLFVLFGPNKSAEIDERGPKQNQKKVDMEAVVALTKSSWRLNDDGWNVNDWDLFSLTWLIHTMFFTQLFILVVPSFQHFFVKKQRICALPFFCQFVGFSFTTEHVN